MGKDAVGYGLDQNLAEHTSTAIRVVLVRDMDRNSEHGFYIKTAFPEMDPRYITPTGKQYRVEDLVNEEKHFANNIDKLTALYRFHKDTPARVECLSEKHDGTPSTMALRWRDQDGKMDVYINEEGVSIRNRTSDGTKRLTKFELLEQCPERAALISAALSDLEKLQQGKEIIVQRDVFQKVR